jgi:hypothetical protein
MMTEQKPYTPDPSFQSVDVMLPEEKKKQQIAKIAAASVTGALTKTANPQPSVAAQGLDWLTRKTRDMMPTDGWAGELFGSKADGVGQVPAVLGLGVPLGLGAMYAGFKGTHGLVDSLRQHEVDSKLKKTKEDYSNFVLKNLANKQASDAAVERELDDLADLYEKDAVANPLAPITDNLQRVKNYAESIYAPYALLSALGAGKLSYDYFKKRSPEEIQEEALHRRAKERYGGTTPIFLEPKPGGDPV